MNSSASFIEKLRLDRASDRSRLSCRAHGEKQGGEATAVRGDDADCTDRSVRGDPYKPKLHYVSRLWIKHVTGSVRPACLVRFLRSGGGVGGPPRAAEAPP